MLPWIKVLLFSIRNRVSHVKILINLTGRGLTLKLVVQVITREGVGKGHVLSTVEPNEDVPNWFFHDDRVLRGDVCRGERAECNEAERFKIHVNVSLKRFI